MTPDEPSAAPRKRSWKRLIVVLACVVVVITIVLLALAPKQEPVKVWFVRATNELGEKTLVFEGTNGAPKQLYYAACVSTGNVRHPSMPPGLRPGYNLISSVGAARTNFSFTLNAPSNGVPYPVMWRFADMRPAQTRWERFRMACFNFFSNHHMPALANRFVPAIHWHYIPSTEIKEKPSGDL